ncbi:MlaD family protein [Mycobacterium sp. IS-1556]|uniref:MlaD family protein n=1 Tax=Mycobacterium sp. IS-1556 TaxID=1772276 RepID=UPI00074151ED|nr:MlaD family protein [Mycobacterium sp. IS-1556]KUH81992.1 mammalian cell entry protein [Mycobacterium sp. IS-1556]
MRPLHFLRNRFRAKFVGVATTAIVLTVVAAAVVGAKTLLPKIDGVRAMCAEFTDAAGLYTGNKVQLLGIEVGEVTAITNESDHVRVDFTVRKDLDLPADVGAVTYGDSIVTDRHVELTKPYAGGPKFTGPQCIAIKSTKTPIGISESFAAIGDLADAILGREAGQDPFSAPGVAAINDSLAAASRSLDGTGVTIKQTLQNLVAMVGDPYKADADYRQLLENSEIFTSGWLRHWDTFAVVIKTLPDTALLIENLSDHFATALSRLVHLLPILKDTLDRFAPRVYHNISDKLIPWVTDLLNAYTPHILEFLNSLPQFTNWLSDIYEPTWGTHNVTYYPPRVAISPTQASAICTELRARNTPGANSACAPGTASDPVTLGLTNLILGGALG